MSAGGPAPGRAPSAPDVVDGVLGPAQLLIIYDGA